MRLIKFGHAPEGVDELGDFPPDPVIHGDVFRRVTMSDGATRLEIGTSLRQIEILRKLSGVLRGPFRILYTLVAPRERDQLEGRYHSEEIDRVELSTFVNRFGTVFEQDGRHALWIIGQDGYLIYSPHDIIYGYGPVDAFEAVVRIREFTRREFAIPAPHVHYYYPQNDLLVRDILTYFTWEHYPLEEMDGEM